MVELAVVPGHSLGSAVLGTSESAVIEWLGQPRERRSTADGEGVSLWWSNPSLRVDLDAQGRVEFCEVTYEDGGPQTTFDGIDLLALPADQVATHLASSLGGSYEEGGHSFTCPTGLALWRPTLPGGDEADPDDRGGQYWRTLAVAARGYW